MFQQRIESLTQEEAERTQDSAERLLRSQLVLCEVPTHLHDGLVLYLLNHVRPGSFLRAVLENDLRNAFGRADAVSARMMPEIMRFLYEFASIGAWGTEDIVTAWLAEKAN